MPLHDDGDGMKIMKTISVYGTYDGDVIVMEEISQDSLT
jgi:hypothetical protein